MKYLRASLFTLLLTILMCIPAYAATSVSFKYILLSESGTESTYSSGTLSYSGSNIVITEGDMSTTMPRNDDPFAIGVDSYYFTGMRTTGDMMKITGNNIYNAIIAGQAVKFYEATTITFNASYAGGSPDTKVSKVYGTPVDFNTMPVKPTKSGWTFDGWYVESTSDLLNVQTNSTTGLLTSAEFPMDNTDVYASFHKDIKATFISGYGEVNEKAAKTRTVRITNNMTTAKIAAPVEPDVGEYKFAGWRADTQCKAATFAKGVDIEFGPDDTTFYAVYEIPSCVTYDTRDVRYPVDRQENVAYYNTGALRGEIPATKVSSINRPGYDLLYWTDGHGHEYHPGDLVHPKGKDLVLTAVYKTQDTVRARVHHRIQKTDGTYEEKDYEELYSLPEEDITPATLSYNGYRAPKLQTKNVGTSGVDFYYNYDRLEYALTVIPCPGVKTPVGNSSLYLYKDTVELEAELYDNYTFNAWVIDGVRYTTNPYTYTIPDHDVVVELDVTPTKYTVTYDANGGDVVTKETDEFGYHDLVDLSVEASKPGYNFIGWSTESTGQVPLEKYEMLNEDLTLYAIYKENPNEYMYRVIYQTSDDLPDAQIIHIEEKEAIKDQVITEAPMAFSGYTALDTPKKMEAEPNTTIYFNYDRNSYTVGVNAKSDFLSNLTGAGTYKVGDNVTVDCRVSNGFIFDGWFGSFTGPTKKYTFKMPPHNVELNAYVHKGLVTFDEGESIDITGAEGILIDYELESTNDMWEHAYREDMNMTTYFDKEFTFDTTKSDATSQYSLSKKWASAKATTRPTSTGDTSDTSNNVQTVDSTDIVQTDLFKDDSGYLQASGGKSTVSANGEYLCDFEGTNGKDRLFLSKDKIREFTNLSLTTTNTANTASLYNKNLTGAIRVTKLTAFYDIAEDPLGLKLTGSYSDINRITIRTSDGSVRHTYENPDADTLIELFPKDTVVLYFNSGDVIWTDKSGVEHNEGAISSIYFKVPASASGTGVLDCTKLNINSANTTGWCQTISEFIVGNGVESHTVTFDPVGGTCSPSTLSIGNGEVIGTLPVPTRPYYSFTGWYTKPGTGTQIDEDVIIENDVTYYAHWTKDESVTLVLDGDLDAIDKVVVKDSNGDIRDEYTDGTIYCYPDDTIILYHDNEIDWIWRSFIGNDNPIRNYKATYAKVPTDAVGSGRLYISFADDAHTIDLSSSSTIGWCRKISGFTLGEGTPVYLIDLMPNSGVVDTNVLYVVKDTPIGEMPIPTYDDFDFTGWFTLANGGTEYTSTSTVNSDMVLYAHWFKPQYQVNFNPNGGNSTFEYIIVNRGAELGELPEVSRLNYDFLGWFTEEEGGEEIDETTIINGDTTYYAHWSKVQYTVTLNANEGECNVPSIKVAHGEKIGALPTPTRTRHTFTGWYRSLTTDEEPITADTVIESDLTIYAHWSEVIDSIKLVGDIESINRVTIKDETSNDLNVIERGNLDSAFETTIGNRVVLTSDSNSKRWVYRSGVNEEELAVGYNCYFVVPDTCYGLGNLKITEEGSNIIIDVASDETTNWCKDIDAAYSGNYSMTLTLAGDFNNISRIEIQEAFGGDILNTIYPEAGTSYQVSAKQNVILYHDVDRNWSFTSNEGVTRELGSSDCCYFEVPTTSTLNGVLYISGTGDADVGDHLYLNYSAEPIGWVEEITDIYLDQLIYDKFTTLTLDCDESNFTRIDVYNSLGELLHSTRDVTSRVIVNPTDTVYLYSASPQVWKTTFDTTTTLGTGTLMCFTVPADASGTGVLKCEKESSGVNVKPLHDDSSGWCLVVDDFELPKYTVQWNSMDGTVVSDSTKNYGELLGTLPTTTRTGYTFNGWYTASSGDNKITSTTPVTKEITYYAQWTINTYTVTFNSMGGSSVDPIERDYNSQLGTLASPTKNGYSFDGWYTESTGGTKVTAATYVKDDVTYFAHWNVNNYTITYTLNGGTLTGQKTSYNVETATFTLPTPTKTGYTFAGWTGSNGTTKQTSVTVSKGTTGNLSYTANWTAISYSITYDLAGGSWPSGAKKPSSYTIESEIKDTDISVPVRSGYVFDGWVVN